jgi:hypothetical protein
MGIFILCAPLSIKRINNGSISGYAKGGSVIRSRGFNSNVIDSSNIGNQTGQGGYQMPGYYGSGTISGKKNLLAYARQSYTSGAGDIIGGGGDSAYIDLNPESVRLTQFGRTNGPMAQAIRESKGQALDLYFQQLSAEKQAAEEEKAKKKAFRNTLIMAGLSALAAGAGSVAKAGYQEGVAGGGGFTAGVEGVFKKFGNAGSALKSLFSGDFKSASAFGSAATTNFSLAPKANIVDEFGPDELFGNRGDMPPIVRATGGSIPSRAGIDTVPAMLSGGEFIMNAGATQRIGANNLNAMNSGASAGTDSSAINEQLINKLDELIRTTKESTKPVTVNVTSTGGQGATEDSTGQSKQDKNLSRKIKEAVVRVLEEEKRLGGVLRRA